MTRLMKSLTNKKQQHQLSCPVISVDKFKKQRIKTNFTLTAQLWFLKFGVDFKLDYEYETSREPTTPLLKLIEQQKGFIDWSKDNTFSNNEVKDKLEELRRIVQGQQQQQQANGCPGNTTHNNNQKTSGERNQLVGAQLFARKTYPPQHFCKSRYLKRDTYLATDNSTYKQVSKDKQMDDVANNRNKNGDKDSAYNSDGTEIDERQLKDSQKVESSSSVEDKPVPVPMEIDSNSTNGQNKPAHSTQIVPSKPAAFLLLHPDSEAHAPEAFELEQSQSYITKLKKRVMEMENCRRQQQLLEGAKLQPYRLAQPQPHTQKVQHANQHGYQLQAGWGNPNLNPAYAQQMWKQALGMIQPLPIDNQLQNAYYLHQQQQQPLRNIWNKYEGMYPQQGHPYPQLAKRQHATLLPIHPQRQFQPQQRKRPLDQLEPPGRQVVHQVKHEELRELIDIDLRNLRSILNHCLAKRKKQLIICDPMQFLETEEEVVGVGAAGAVVAVRGRRTPNSRALVLKRTRLLEYIMEDNSKKIDPTFAVREVAAMNLEHPNLMSLEQVYLFDNTVCILMNRMVGTVSEYMKYETGGCLSELFATHVLIEVTKGLIHLHESGFIHADIKADNVLISPKGEIKLADFGHAGIVGFAESDFRGTPAFIAPEVANNRKFWNESADLWSLGIMMIELIDGKAPTVEGFDYNNLDERRLRELMWAIANRPEAPKPVQSVSSSYKKAMDQILKLNYYERANAQQFLKHLNDAVSKRELRCISKESFQVLVQSRVGDAGSSFAPDADVVPPRRVTTPVAVAVAAVAADFVVEIADSAPSSSVSANTSAARSAISAAANAAGIDNNIAYCDSIV